MSHQLNSPKSCVENNQSVHRLDQYPSALHVYCYSMSEHFHMKTSDGRWPQIADSSRLNTLSSTSRVRLFSLYIYVGHETITDA